MAQLNLNLDDEFEKNLAEFMRLRQIPTKSAAIRLALKEGVEKLRRIKRAADFNQWLGAGLAAPLNPKPRFKTHDDVWDK